MKKLNLTDLERASVRVTFSVSRFVATCGDSDFVIGRYADKSSLKRDFAENGITNASFDAIAQRAYLNWSN